MGFIDRIVMLFKSNVNAIVTKAEDPAKILDQSINDMQEDLAKLRQAVTQSIAALKLQEEQYNESATQAQECEKRAILAIQKGEENLAREALSRKKTHLAQGGLATPPTNQLKNSLVLLLTKLSKNNIVLSIKFGQG